MNQAGSPPPNEVRSAADASPGRAKALGRAIGIAAGVSALVLLGRVAGDRVPEIAAWVEGLGWWAPAAFVVTYALATVAFVPGSLLTLVAGAIFGVLHGTAIVFVAASTGAALAFGVARTLARTAIERRLAGNERFAAIDRAVARDGRKIMLLLRLSPVFPFNLLNYALGLTKVRFGDYLIACIGMLPGTLLYVYYGALAGEVATLAGGATVEKGAGYYGLLTIGAVATIAVATLATRIARRALDEATRA